MHLRYQERWIIDTLASAEAAVRETRTDDLAGIFSRLPADLFLCLYFDCPAEYPALVSWLPQLPSEADQIQWTGAAGWPTMYTASQFVDDCFARLDPRANPVVLDYGCGWGRMVRLLYRHARVSDIHGIDPWEPSLAQLAGHRVHGHFSKVDRMPEALPFGSTQFDLVYAYSVFTHIGPTSQAAVLAAIRERIARDGLLALTVRSGEFWMADGRWPDEATRKSLLERHRSEGFAYIENPPVEGGHTDYGRCSISLDYVERNWRDWRLDGVEWRVGDPHQTTVFLRPV